MTGETNGLRLSVLEQSPGAAGSTPAEALQNSIGVARRVDELGDTRCWMSEHHAMDTLACTAPEIMLARLGAETKGLRIGSGGIMLPDYTSLQVAGEFGMLHGLYPAMRDLRGFGGGVGRERREATVAVGVICAERQEEAEYLASSGRLLQRRIRQGDRRPVASPEDALRELRLLGEIPMEEGEWPRYFVGTPTKVRGELEEMAGALGIEELIVNTIVWDHAKRLRSYELLAGVVELALVLLGVCLVNKRDFFMKFALVDE